MSRWPHIARYLRKRSGWVDDDFRRWWDNSDRLAPAERAAANEEWADFFEWRLAQGAEDRLVAKWTDSMAYCCRRSAAWARGEDPGEWVPQHVRRPDLDVTS